MKVLVSAYGCEPGKGSEPGVGWHWALQAASFSEEVVVLTRTNNRTVIETSGEIPANLRFEYLDLSPRLLRLKRGPRGARIYYILWQRQVSRWLKGRLAVEHFDVVHHLTWASINLPIGVAASSVPLVVGPLGGGVGTCWPLWRDFGARGWLFELQRTCLQRLNQLRPSVRKCLLGAQVILVQNQETADRVPLPAKGRVRVISNGGVESSEIVRRGTHDRASRDGTLKAIYAGRVLHYKGLRTVVKALAEQEGLDIELRVLGEGPDLRRVKSEAKRLGVSSRVHFDGQVNRSGVLSALDHSDVLVLLSHHEEGAPFVVIEALARGVRPVVLARGGPLGSIGNAGIAVSVAPAETLPVRVARACHDAMRISEDQLHTQALNWTWPSRAETLRKAYLDAIGVPSVLP